MGGIAQAEKLSIYWGRINGNYYIEGIFKWIYLNKIIIFVLLKFKTKEW